MNTITAADTTLIESKIYNALYDYQADATTRYDDSFEGFIFQNINIEEDSKIATFYYDEVLSEAGIFTLLDNGDISANDETPKFEELARQARESYDPFQELHDSREISEALDALEEHGGEGWIIDIHINRALDSETVREWWENRIQELQEEQEEEEI